MTFLLLVTVTSMVVAVIMGVIAWRIAGEERRRSEARIAALAADIHAAPMRDGGRGRGAPRGTRPPRRAGPPRIGARARQREPAVARRARIATGRRTATPGCLPPHNRRRRDRDGLWS